MLTVTRLRIAALAAVAGALLLPAVAAAHPLGNFTINHASALRVAATGVVVDHVIDMAEIPTFSAFREVDTDGDGIASDPERAAAARSRCADQAGALVLSVGGASIPLSVTGSAISFPMGQGAPTLRLVCRLEAAVAGGVAGEVAFSDPTYAERAGWREITAAGDGMTVRGDVTAQGPSARLTSYPTGLLARAPTESAVTFSVQAGGPALPRLVQPEIDAAAAAGDGTAAVPGDGTGAVPGDGTAAVPGGIAELGGDLAAVFQADELTPWMLLLSMLAAAGLGALHALSPGHGKTVMAAYLVGSRGTSRQALGLGATVTVSHTLGVLALGAVSLSASAVIAPERLYPILGVVSGAIVIVIAGWLLLGIGRSWWTARSAAQAHLNAHAHDHDHGQGHAHDQDTGPAHPHPHVAVAADHAGAAHDRVHPDRHPHASAAAATDPDGWHSHGGIRHTHVLPAGRPLHWRSLFALGLAGGMVPSVSALILLLGSIAAGRPAYGIALTIAFGVGMAVVLVGIGVGLVHARALLERMPARLPGRRLGRLVPAGSATVMLLAGVLITAQAALTLH